MALKQYSVTLSGGNDQAVTTHTPIRQLTIENEVGNALVKYGTSSISSTDYAGSVPANTDTVSNARTIGPFSGELPLNLDDFRFLGTKDDVIHLTVVT